MRRFCHFLYFCVPLFQDVTKKIFLPRTDLHFLAGACYAQSLGRNHLQASVWQHLRIYHHYLHQINQRSQPRRFGNSIRRWRDRHDSTRGFLRLSCHRYETKLLRRNAHLHRSRHLFDSVRRSKPQRQCVEYRQFSR